MSDASRHALYYVAESTYGTTPATPTMKRLRHTGTTLGTAKSTNVSEELRPDRQIADFRHGTKQVGGDVSFELSYGSFDDLLQAVMLGTWAVKATVTDDDIAAAAPSTFTSVTTDFVALGFEVGDKIDISGFTDPANNGRFTIATVSANEITIVEATLVSEVAGDVVTVATAAIELLAGVTRRSFTLMRHFSDILEAGKPFHKFEGVEFNTFSLSVSPGAIITGSFGIIGQGQTLLGTAPDGSTLQAPTTTRVFDSFTGELKENGAAIAIVTEISLTLENGLEPRFVVFSDETLQPSVGRSNATGQITVYFENATMLAKFLDETPTSLEFALVDEDGNELRFVLPNIKYTGGQPDTSGQGSITLAMPFQAVYDETAGSQMIIRRSPAA